MISWHALQGEIPSLETHLKKQNEIKNNKAKSNKHDAVSKTQTMVSHAKQGCWCLEESHLTAGTSLMLRGAPKKLANKIGHEAKSDVEKNSGSIEESSSSSSATNIRLVL